MKNLSVFDLFSGCGGLSLGLRRAGFDIAWANEIDPHAASTFEMSHPETMVFQRDVTELYEQVASRDNGCPMRGDVDLLVGGPPCQGFSGYNRHRNASDPRNSLLDVFLDFVDVLRPRHVLMENVPGMLSLDEGKFVDKLMAAYDTLGYRTRLGILQAGYYGLPQNRWRVFVWAALSSESLPEFPEPTHAFQRTTIFGAKAFRDSVVKPPTEGKSLIWNPKDTVTVADAISDLPKLENGENLTNCAYRTSVSSEFQEYCREESVAVFDHHTKKLGELMMERCRAIPKRAGAGWLDLPDELKPKNLMRHGDRRYDNRFGRLHWGGTFNTILTEAHPYWSCVFHPKQNRVISVRESARAQGFPDCVHFQGPMSKKYRQVGNAVPPPVAFHLATELAKSMSRKRRA